MDQFRIEKVKDVGPGEMFYFKIQVQPVSYTHLTLPTNREV